MKILLVLALLLSYSVGYSQNFVELDTTSFQKREETKKLFENKFEAYNKSLTKVYSGKLKKSLLVAHKKHQKDIFI